MAQSGRGLLATLAREGSVSHARNATTGLRLPQQRQRAPNAVAPQLGQAHPAAKRLSLRSSLQKVAQSGRGLLAMLAMEEFASDVPKLARGLCLHLQRQWDRNAMRMLPQLAPAHPAAQHHSLKSRLGRVPTCCHQHVSQNEHGFHPTLGLEEFAPDGASTLSHLGFLDSNLLHPHSRKKVRLALAHLPAHAPSPSQWLKVWLTPTPVLALWFLKAPAEGQGRPISSPEPANPPLAWQCGRTWKKPLRCELEYPPAALLKCCCSCALRAP